MVELKIFVFNDFGVNAYIVYDETREAVIIDGAVNSDSEMSLLRQFVASKGLQVKYIVNTHGHLDHICGNDRLKAEYKVPVLANFKDNDLVENVGREAAMFGFRMNRQSLPDQNIADGDIIKFGNSSLKVLEVPGHSQGSVALYCEDGNYVVCGDALFCGGIGRTDLPGGSYAQLIDSISKKLFVLPADCRALPGHGPSTTIGYEVDNNPFF